MRANRIRRKPFRADAATEAVAVAAVAGVLSAASPGRAGVSDLTDHAVEGYCSPSCRTKSAVRRLSSSGDV
jgi:hypothetical protein